MRITAGDIVLLRIIDHETKIRLESESVLVHSCVEFRAHGTKIHRVFYHRKVTGGEHVSEYRNRDYKIC